MMVARDNLKVTPKQKEFIKELLVDMNRIEDYEVLKVDKLSIQEAKELIQQLLEERDDYFMSISRDIYDMF